MNRRNFILASAAAAGATWFDVPDLLADTIRESKTKYGGFRMGLQSYSLRAFDAPKALQIMEDLEVHFVEFYKNHFSPDSSAEDIKAMSQLLKQHNIKHSAHGVNRFTADHEANRILFQFAQDAGIRNLSAFPVAESYQSVEKLLGEFPDIRIAIHNHGPGNLYDKISDVEKAVDGRHPHFGVCADLGHFIRSGDDPVEAVTRLQGRVFGIHLKDFASSDADNGGKHAADSIIGEGLLDIVAVFEALKKTKFPADGAMSLEYEGEKDAPVASIEKCLAAAAEAAKQVRGKKSA